MQRNIALFLIKVCHMDYLPCAVYGIWYQYISDILSVSTRLDND